MTSRFEEKFREQRKRIHRRRFLKKIILFFLLLFVCTSIVGWGLFSERFRIRDITLSGFSRTSDTLARLKLEQELSKKYAYVIPRDSLWMQNTRALEALLIESFPTLKKVDVRREFPRSLRVHAIEYDAWGVLCHGNNAKEECFWIDRDGVAFALAPNFTGIIVPKINDERSQEYRIGNTYMNPALMNLVAFFNERTMSDDTLQSLQFIIDAHDETLRMRTRAGWDILLLASNDPEKSYRNLKTALSSEIKDAVANLEYIDLRFGNRVFYKFK